ncbi:MAG: hypothetical protein ACXVZO_03600 [Gaiellaceae bacterium]
MSVPRRFLPQLTRLCERLVTFHDFDQIEQSARDTEAGRTIKPMLRLG